MCPTAARNLTLGKRQDWNVLREGEPWICKSEARGRTPSKGREQRAGLYITKPRPMDLLPAYSPPLIFLQDGRIYSRHVRRIQKRREEDDGAFSDRKASGHSAWSRSLEDASKSDRIESTPAAVTPFPPFLSSSLSSVSPAFSSVFLFLCSSSGRTRIIDSVGVSDTRWAPGEIFGERNTRRGYRHLRAFLPSFQEDVLSRECNWSRHYGTRLLTCTTESQIDRRRGGIMEKRLHRFLRYVNED